MNDCLKTFALSTNKANGITLPYNSYDWSYLLFIEQLTEMLVLSQINSATKPEIN